MAECAFSSLGKLSALADTQVRMPAFWSSSWCLSSGDHDCPWPDKKSFCRVLQFTGDSTNISTVVVSTENWDWMGFAFPWGQFIHESQKMPFTSLYFLLCLLALIFGYYHLLLGLNPRAQLNSFLSCGESHISPSIGSPSNRAGFEHIIFISLLWAIVS